MNFEYIEHLVLKCKNNDVLAKEKLTEEFRPFIYNLSKRTFIDGYTIYDIQNECYHTLFKCVTLYDIEKHRFIGYAINSIKNNINDLIKRIKLRQPMDGQNALSLNNNIEKQFISEDINCEEALCSICDLEDLKTAIKNLTEEELELVKFIFFENKTINDYAVLKKLRYANAVYKKKIVLKKISSIINLFYDRENVILNTQNNG